MSINIDITFVSDAVSVCIPFHRQPQHTPRYTCFPAMRNPRAHTAPGDVTRGVALKAIPKKKAKGNEESVWK